jgi:hypothetical protein
MEQLRWLPDQQHVEARQQMNADVRFFVRFMVATATSALLVFLAAIVKGLL